jgi:hypothetical protein
VGQNHTYRRAGPFIEISAPESLSAPVQVNLHQAVSRILHARSVDVMSNQYTLLARITSTTGECARLVSQYQKEDKKYFEPVLFFRDARRANKFSVTFKVN